MTIDRIDLERVVGGLTDQEQQAIRDQVREEMDLEQKERERDEFRDWEKRHPFSALICQGDHSCMRR